jgi:hypothetical protein
MGFLKNNLINILVVAVLVAAAFYAYTYFSGGDENQAVLVTTPQEEIGADLLEILTNLQTLKLDDSLFASPTFRNLKNFQVELTPEPVGRDNPFAPYSGGAASNNSIQIKSFSTQ